MGNSRHHEPTGPVPTVAIVGSGPSGCYTAQFLKKTWADAEITIFEALPVPYGLVRYGVAADHQGSKSVTRQFDRLFEKSRVRFAGNVAIGRDLSFDALVNAFDIVVLATGLAHDRSLGIPEDAAATVLGAGTLLRTLNGHPAVDEDIERIGDHLVVVGAGNVSIDVLRLFSKVHDDFHGSDIDDDALARLRPEPVHTIDVVIRSAASSAKFEVSMLKELAALPNVSVEAHGVTDDETCCHADAVRGAAEGSMGVTDDTAGTRIRLHFGMTPTSIRRHGDQTVLAATGKDGSTLEFAADAIITAIGFVPEPAPTASSPELWGDGAHIYRVGWLRRGPTGAIPENRRDAQQVAAAIIDDVATGAIAVGAPGWSAVENEICSRVVDFASWQKLNAFELSQATASRIRKKVTDLDQMLALASQGPQSPTTH